MLVLVLLLVAVAGAWLGAMMDMDPGYVLLAWRQTTVEMSLWVWLVLTLVLYVGVYFSVKVLFSLKAPWQLIGRWSEDGRLRRLQLQTRQGLLALANGQYKRAVEKLSPLADADTQPLVVIPALAQALARMGQCEQAQKRLQTLPKLVPEAKQLVLMESARVYKQCGDAEAALKQLQAVSAQDKQHSQANEMQLEILQGLQRWTGVIELLQVIANAKQMSAEVLAEQQRKAYSHAFVQVAAGEQGVENLLQLWRKAPETVKNSGECRLAMVQAMHASEGDPAKRTAEFIENSLQQKWHDGLVLEYAHLPMANLERALTKAEAWQKQAQDSGALQLTLGRLCRRLELWGKSRDYLHASIRLQPSKEAHAELARLEQQLGELDKALEHYRLASVF
jgi:HemY protein